MKTFQPFPQSGVSEFGQWIVSEDFSCVALAGDSTEKVESLSQLFSNKIDAIFPKKEIKIYDGDKEWMRPQLRILRRQKNREYQKNKKSIKFIELEKKFHDMKDFNSREYIKKKVEELKNSTLRKFYSKIKEAGSRLGECQKSSFSVSSHVELNLQPDVAAERIAQHFSTISKEFPPIDAYSLPQRVKEKIFHPEVSKSAPHIEEYEVYEMFKKRGFKQSSVPGDIPSILKKEFSAEIAVPASKIFNSITKSGTYPRQWVTEYVTPIPKVTKTSIFICLVPFTLNI